MGAVGSAVLDPRRVLDGLGVRASRIRLLARRRNTYWRVDTPEQRLVLCRYAADRSRADVAYELRLLTQLAGRGWPVPAPVAPVIEAAGATWSVVSYLAGRAPAPRSVAGARAEQRQRGRLLAQLHTALADVGEMGQRDEWRQAHEGLFERPGQPSTDAMLRQYERRSPDQGQVLRTYFERMEERLRALLPYAPAPIVIHGDFTPWNLRYSGGRLSGVLDFEMAHQDLRVADFVLSWRGQYAEVITGYAEVARLEPIEQELLVPIFWAWIIAVAVADIEAGAARVDWPVKLLLRTAHARAGH